jgi:hypothetical protein
MKMTIHEIIVAHSQAHSRRGWHHTDVTIDAGVQETTWKRRVNNNPMNDTGCQFPKHTSVSSAANTEHTLLTVVVVVGGGCLCTE